MTDEEKREIQDFLPQYARARLEHIPGHKERYVCPFCGHGRGSLCFSVFQSGGTWLFKCHHGDCLRGGDFFKLIAYRDGLDVRRDWPQVIQAAALEAGVIVTDDRPRTAEERAEAIRKKQQRQRLDAVKDHLRQWYTDTLDILRQCYTVLDRDTERPQGDKYGDFARLRIDEIEQLYDYFYDLRNNGAIWWTLIELYRDPTFNDRIERMKRYSEDRRAKQ